MVTSSNCFVSNHAHDTALAHAVCRAVIPDKKQLLLLGSKDSAFVSSKNRLELMPSCHVLILNKKQLLLLGTQDGGLVRSRNRLTW